MNKDKLISNLSSRSRALDEPSSCSTIEQSYSGLVLSDVIHKELTFFKKNEINSLFRGMKSDDYFKKIKKDISETGCILNPLITMPSGLLIEGETRLLIAEQLFSEGNNSFERIPVRIILSQLDENEQKRRLILGNLSRFEIDENSRLLLYSEIWSDFFSIDKKRGRPIKMDTVSDLSPSSDEISKASGISERQLRREKKVFMSASDLAHKQGKEKPDLQDIQTARTIHNQERKKPEKKPIGSLQKDSSCPGPLANVIVDIILDTFLEIIPSISFPYPDSKESPIISVLISLIDQISQLTGLDPICLGRIHEYQAKMEEVIKTQAESKSIREAPNA